jgi:hypothetical protein
MGELIEDNKLGRKVAAEGFEGPGLDPSNKGQDKAQEGVGLVWISW